MVRLLGIGWTAGLLATLLPLADAAAQQSEPPPDAAVRSVLDGVYTEAQAERGEAAFAAACTVCHIPGEFVGLHFQHGWDGQRVFQLFYLIRSTMPMDNPGGLSAGEYADIIAYFLKLNGYPAGETEMGADRDALTPILIELIPVKPDQ